MEFTDQDPAVDGTPTAPPGPWDPYRAHRVIHSAGRTLLTEAFSEYMALTAGISPLEIAGAFDDDGDTDDRSMIEREIRFLAGLFVDGRIGTFARLVGGGEPIDLPRSVWEIDDAIARFATGTINPDCPHDPGAISTHWLFVDGSEWEAAMAGLRDSRKPIDAWDEPVGGHLPSAITIVQSQETIGQDNAQAVDLAPEPWRNEILNLDGVEHITGLKRSTIYAKVAAGDFPRSISIHGTRKGWRRGAVQDWLDKLPS